MRPACLQSTQPLHQLPSPSLSRSYALPHTHRHYCSSALISCVLPRRRYLRIKPMGSAILFVQDHFHLGKILSCRAYRATMLRRSAGLQAARSPRVPPRCLLVRPVVTRAGSRGHDISQDVLLVAVLLTMLGKLSCARNTSGGARLPSKVIFTGISAAPDA